MRSNLVRAGLVAVALTMAGCGDDAGPTPGPIAGPTVEGRSNVVRVGDRTYSTDVVPHMP
jgi:hypothetical protein